MGCLAVYLGGIYGVFVRTDYHVQDLLADIEEGDLRQGKSGVRAKQNEHSDRAAARAKG